MNCDKQIIVVACSQRKRHGGDTNIRWQRSNSVAKGLSKTPCRLLMKCRHQLAEKFGYAPGEDLGGETRTPVPLMLARERYDGNLYRKISGAIWEPLRDSANVEVVIVSALYGLVTPWELIRDYEMAMTEKIETRVRLARWWSQQGLGSILVDYAQRADTRIVHDFLGGAYGEVSEAFSCLSSSVRVVRHSFARRYSAADYYRGWEIERLLEDLLQPDIS